MGVLIVACGTLGYSKFARLLGPSVFVFSEADLRRAPSTMAWRPLQLARAANGTELPIRDVRVSVAIGGKPDSKCSL